MDKDGSKGVKKAMKNAELANKNSLTSKGVNENEPIDLDKNLSEAGFTDVQKEFVSKVTALYLLNDSEADKVAKNDINEDKIKEGLLLVRNDVSADMRLNAFQKEQLYTHIDVQYATLSSIVNYTEKLLSATQQTGKFRFSFKKFVNIVFSVVATTAVFTATTLSKIGTLTIVNPYAVIVAGASVGFATGVINVAFRNPCLKICGGMGSWIQGYVIVISCLDLLINF